MMKEKAIAEITYLFFIFPFFMSSRLVKIPKTMIAGRKKINRFITLFFSFKIFKSIGKLFILDIVKIEYQSRY
jgi:hypothetical protein